MLTELTVEQALDQIRRHAPLLPAEELPAARAAGRLLAADVLSPMDQPPFDRSPIDGYALRAADTTGACRERPARLTISDTVYAGGCPSGPMSAGQAVRIMTGGMLPPGCDCVIRQEDTDLGGETVEVYREMAPWDNYVRAGEDFRTGDVLLPAGARLDAAAFAVLSSAGFDAQTGTVRVRALPRVAVLCTGDELVYPGSPLPPGKIYDSNLTFLTRRLDELGIPQVAGGQHFQDDPELVAASVRSALEQADAVITTGGVSVGAKDIMHAVLPLLGAEQIFTRTRVKPGTPAIFSTVGGKPVLALSGNPFAAAATFELFGRPMLSALSGDSRLDVTRTSAVLRGSFPKGSAGRRFVRGAYADGAVTLPAGHSSGQMRSLVGCNCLVDIPAGSGPLSDGQTVSVVLL